MHYAAWTPVSLRSTTANWVFGLPVALIHRDEESREEDRPSLPRFLLQALVFAHSSCGGLSPNRPSLQGNLLPIRDLAASPLQCVRTAQSSGALRNAMASGGACASRRFSQVAGSSALVREFRQGRQPMLWAHRQYPRFGVLWKWDLDTTGDHCRRNPRPVPQSAVQFRRRLLLRELILARSVRTSPFRQRKSPHRIRLALPQGGHAHRLHHNHVPGHCQLMTGARSPIYLLSVGQTIRGRTTSPTLIQSVMCPWYSRLQHFGSVSGRSQQGAVMAEKEKELSRHTRRASRRQRVGGYLSRSSDSVRIWPRREGLPRFLLHHTIFDHGLSDGLGPDEPRLLGNLLYRKDWIQLRKIALSDWVLSPVQEVAAHSWCTEFEHLRSGICPEERRAKWAHVVAGRRGIGAQARSMAPVRDVRTAPATRNQNTRSNSKTRVCPWRDSLYTSSSGLPGTGLEVLSSKSIGSLSAREREQKV